MFPQVNHIQGVQKLYKGMNTSRVNSLKAGYYTTTENVLILLLYFSWSLVSSSVVMLLVLLSFTVLDT